MSRVGFRVDALVATRDPRGNGIVVTGWEPGPAGVAVLDLRGGDAVLVADVAEPDLLVSLQLPELAGEDSQRIADTVLGAGVINELRQLRGDGTPAVVWRRQDQARRTVIGQGGLGLIGRLAVGLAEITAADRSEAAIAIGLVEAGVGAVLLDREISPSPSGLALVRAGVARWEDLPPFAFDGLGMPTVDRLTVEAQRWAATVGTVDDRLGAALERLAIRLRGRFGPDVAAAGAVGGARPTSAPPPPAAAGAPSLRGVGSSKKLSAAAAAAPTADAMRSEKARLPEVAVEVDGRLAAGADVRIISTELDGHHLTVHVGGLRQPSRSWLRVFADDRTSSDGDRPTLLALAPFDGSGRPWSTAVALVPPDLARADRLLVDVTDEPTGPWRSSATRATQSAAAMGAVAARATRRGARDASDRWSACSDAWERIGDARRAGLAAAYAGSGPVYAGGGLLVDEL